MTKPKEITFETTHSIDEVKLLLANYFKKTFHSNDKTVRHSGVFVSDNEFEIRSKWSLIFGSKPYKSKPYAIGRIMSDDNSRTRIRLIIIKKAVKWYAFLPLLIPVYLIGSQSFIAHNSFGIIIGIQAFCFMGLFYFIGYRSIRNKIISELMIELNLKQITNGD